jgi:hypothetical protein
MILKNARIETEILVQELNLTVQKAKLIHQIEIKSRESENASPEKLHKILIELKSYREQLKQLYEQGMNIQGKYG